MMFSGALDGPLGLDYQEVVSMTATIEVPKPPRPQLESPFRLEAPLVPVEPHWEYREITRDLRVGVLPTEEELNQLGAEEWELAGVVSVGDVVHFYFKRARYG
jgi:hypothetical protein